MTEALPLSHARFSRWFLLGALLLPLLYLPTLKTRFDFIDDGNLVYPAKPMPFGERAGVVWQKIVANYEHLGPFRPVLWAHWEAAADLLQGSELGWRITRLVWCGLAGAMLLWLFAELGMDPLAALFAAAVAMWNPYRNEIWTSLTLSEGVAMPYALLALISARRAAVSRTPWPWDVLGALCVLAALGCKNTFAALVPAQVFLRLAPDGLSLQEGWRRHGRRALLLGLTLLAPAVHYVYFKLNWHPGQYTPHHPTVAQFRRLLSGLVGAMNVNYLGLGLVLAVAALFLTRRRDPAAGLGGFDFVARHRAALGAGILLLLGGIFMYLPMDAMSGRYTMPAVWGLDIILAALLSDLAALPLSRWTRAAWACLAVGLAVVMLANVGRQQKFAARARLLWEALEWVEHNAPANARLAWYSGDSLKGGLDVEEGIHFQWHLKARGRGDIRVCLYDDQGKPCSRCELPLPDRKPDLAVWGPGGPGVNGTWEMSHHFAARYWAGRRKYECFLGEPHRSGPRGQWASASPRVGK